MRHLQTGLQLVSLFCITEYFNFDDFDPDAPIRGNATTTDGSSRSTPGRTQPKVPANKSTSTRNKSNNKHPQIMNGVVQEQADDLFSKHQKNVDVFNAASCSSSTSSPSKVLESSPRSHLQELYGALKRYILNFCYMNLRCKSLISHRRKLAAFASQIWHGFRFCVALRRLVMRSSLIDHLPVPAQGTFARQIHATTVESVTLDHTTSSQPSA